VTRDERWCGLDGPVSISGVKVGVANAARDDFDQQFARTRSRHWPLFDDQRFAEFTYYGGLHRLRRALAAYVPCRGRCA